MNYYNEYLKNVDINIEKNNVNVTLKLDHDKIEEDVEILRKILLRMRRAIGKDFSITICDNDMRMFVDPENFE